jgi:squalene-hopene/tetraprenyl-beta-curcumene cyclase
MDGRQETWFAWPRANTGAKPCISCHTGLPYLLARPELRKALGEKEPTKWETGLLASLSGRLDKKTPLDNVGLGVESVMAGLFLKTPEALDRMWVMQQREGKATGAWKWFSLDQTPWEDAESDLFGASLAAIAVGTAPEAYRKQPEVKERVAALTAYLRGPHEKQPFQNTLAMVWAASKLPEAMDPVERKKAMRDALGKQEDDGGWSLGSLGPWNPHPNAPPQSGSNTYATAFTAYVLMESGMQPTDARIAKALTWLRTHQSEHGYFFAASMNRVYPADSVEVRFMRDAATGYASLALLKVR